MLAQFGDGVAIRRGQVADVELECERRRERQRFLELRRRNGAGGAAIRLIVNRDRDLMPLCEGSQAGCHRQRQGRRDGRGAERLHLPERRLDLVVGERVVVRHRTRVNRKAGGGQFSPDWIQGVRGCLDSPCSQGRTRGGVGCRDLFRRKRNSLRVRGCAAHERPGAGRSGLDVRKGKLHERDA